MNKRTIITVGSTDDTVTTSKGLFGIVFTDEQDNEFQLDCDRAVAMSIAQLICKRYGYKLVELEDK